MASPFEVLGIPPDADEAELERAYRERVKETHPDLDGSRAQFQAVREAYDAITAGAVADLGEVTVDTGADGPTADAAPDAEAGQSADSTVTPDAPPADAGDEGSTDATDAGARVEFLNYDVLADHGWELTDDDLFEKAAAADLPPADYGCFLAPETDTLLSAAEDHGYAWPFACRGGACANCAVAVRSGDLDMPNDQILSDDMVADGIRLSCFATPAAEELQVVYNVKELPGLADLRLPADRFEGARGSD